MLQVQQLSKIYGTRVLFDEVTFALTPGERLGLVGLHQARLFMLRF